MNHAEFCKKYIGKNIDFDNAYWFQCVDLPRQYWKDMSYTIWAFWWSAWNGWKTGCPFDKTWKKIVYKPWLIPKEWDILFWNENRCKNGHVAIANKLCDTNILRYIDQNGTWKQDKIQARFTDYKNLVWWFTKKPLN